MLYPFSIKFQLVANIGSYHSNYVSWELTSWVNVVKISVYRGCETGIAANSAWSNNTHSLCLFYSTALSNWMNIDWKFVIVTEGSFCLIVKDIEQIAIIIVPFVELWGILNNEDVVFGANLRLMNFGYEIGLFFEMMFGELFW